MNKNANSPARSMHTGAWVVHTGMWIAQVALFHDHDGRHSPRLLVNEFQLGCGNRNYPNAFSASLADFRDVEAVAAFMVGADPCFNANSTFHATNLSEEYRFYDEINIEGSGEYNKIRAAYGEGVPSRVHVTFQYCLVPQKERIIEQILVAERERVASVMGRYTQQWARLHEFDPGLAAVPKQALPEELAERIAFVLESQVSPERQDAGSAAAREALSMIAQDVICAVDVNGLAEIDVAIAAMLQARAQVAALVEKGHKQGLDPAEAPKTEAPADDSPAPGL